MRQYSQAYAFWKILICYGCLRDIERYLTSFLLDPDGAFYVSQDADRIMMSMVTNTTRLTTPAAASSECRASTKNQYARENGWAISGLSGILQRHQ